MFSEKALYALVQEDLLIFGEVFRMQRFHIGHLVIPVEEFIFALTHLVEGKELHTRKPDFTQERSKSLCIRQLRIEARNHRDPGQNVKPLFLCPAEIPVDHLSSDAGPLFYASLNHTA